MKSFGGTSNKSAAFWVDYLAPGTDERKSYESTARRLGCDRIEIRSATTDEVLVSIPLTSE